MDKRLLRLMNSGMNLAFIFLLIFAGLSALYSIPLAVAELAAVILLFLYYHRWRKKRATQIRKYVESLAFQVDDASKHSITYFPLPTTIFRLDTGEIIWGNEAFGNIIQMGEELYGSHISDVISDFDTRWLMEGKTICPYDVRLGGRKFTIYGNMVRSSSDVGRSLLATLYWVDVTDYSNLRVQYERTRPVVALIMLDSYDELYKGLSEAEKSSLNAQVDEQVMAWARPSGGVIRRLDRDKYLFVFDHAAMLEFTADKFSILERSRTITNPAGVHATLSIGIGRGDASFGELYDFASLGLDMALSRGGDQVVIKTKNAFEFYGGSSKEVEKRTKVKSRVIANALMQLIRDSSQVFIMGHRHSDLDCIGAAAGLCPAIRKTGTKAYIVVDRGESSARELIDQLAALPEYENCFIDGQEAMMLADSASLLIVVDTSRPDIVESRDLLETVTRVAVIDHHRRAASYIENPTISLHEPYASSASELVAELLQYVVSPGEILKLEAEAMLSGIALDTKTFTVKTGVRTFEAAAYLRQLGADTVEVKKLFSGNLDNYVKRYQLISAAVEAFPGISMVITDRQTARATAAQAADELISLAGINASFVVFREGDGTSVSARSYGKINVQVILEKIGGGGSLTMAGAQFAGEEPGQVAEKLRQTIVQVLEESKRAPGKPAE